MADKTGIEWTDATWNPIRGCSRVSEGCRNCYAERVAGRFYGPGEPYEGLVRLHPYGEAREGDSAIKLKTEARWTGQIQFVEKHLEDPTRWRRPRKIFVNSMSDLFHENVKDEWLWEIFDVMEASKRHVFQILTKRPERMSDWIRANYGVTFHRRFTHVWLGVSVEDQKTATQRVPILQQTPAAIRWVSYEPALGPVDFTQIDGRNYLLEFVTGNDFKIPRSIDWVVCGGESGPGARPMHPDWARGVRDQCARSRVPFFFKQWGEWIPGAANGFTQWPEIDPRRPILMPAHPGRKGRDMHQVMIRVGKKAAANFLDGQQYLETPLTMSDEGIRRLAEDLMKPEVQ